MGQLIYINGAPGVGKLSIAQALAESLKARVLDNHAIYNVAFALTDFRSPAFYDAVRAVRTASYERILQMPDGETVILTAADFSDTDWGRENWSAVNRLAVDRRWPFYSIALQCAPAEHRGRIISGDRAWRGKLQDAGAVDLLNRRPLVQGVGRRSLCLDVTLMSAREAADSITEWVHQSTME